VLEPQDITLKNLPYKFPTRSALTLQAELDQIENAVKQGFPRIELKPVRDDALCIVGFGPSLQDTWQHITHPCITMSGSHDFLLSKGVVPDYHAQCDGRDHQARFIEHPNHGTQYLMASICCPKIWEQLKGHDVRLWHNAHGKHVVDWIGEHDSGGVLVVGGSTIGLCSIHLGGILGFRKFRCFGMDGNYKDFKRHAGEHYDPQTQGVIRRWANGRKWFTSPQMSNAVDEFIRLATNSELEFDVYGTSLLTDALEEAGLVY
jgi:hypothetical protein